MIRAGIVGATGYTGMELVRILLEHPGVRLTYVTSRTWSGRPLANALPGLTGWSDLLCREFDATEAAGEVDIIFLCLPHGEAMDTVFQLHSLNVRQVDLSADFRIADPKIFGEWYGPHRHPQLLTEAVSGYPELYREDITGAVLVANPGCYPTTAVYGLLPLAEVDLLDPRSIVVDSKSGVSGAGKEPRGHLHFPEVEGNFSAYAIAGTHRHVCEMDQELSKISGKSVQVTFTPHLAPLSRGILSTIYARTVSPLNDDGIFELYRKRYEKEPFIRVRSPDQPLPTLKDVRGTNLCIVAPRVDRRSGITVIVSCIDNLVKGASGQAVQNMNIMSGLPETMGLESLPLTP
ncbi:MAG: N-acetyl-gamma-glutamyl-phosphate reductase [bacterium]|nr:MAG: N-acetyl-gamma-glutamyl-phosphate reductase [bacterium]